MNGKYIFAIVVFAVFFVLIFISFALLEHERIKEHRKKAWISELYNNKEVKKYDYDSEGEEELVSDQTETDVDEVEDTEEEIADVKPPKEEFEKIDVEGIEEITGNYKGDK